MAPLMDSPTPQQNGRDPIKPRLLIIGAGSRGNAYARAVVDSNLGQVVAIAEPIAFKRCLLGSKYIWPNQTTHAPEQEFENWADYIQYELQRRKDAAAGNPNVLPGIDGVFVCVRDQDHVHVLTAIAPLGLHVMSEKPLATTLEDCLRIQKALTPASGAEERVFAIGHVLRYSPHNMLLRHLVREKKVIGEVLSIEHVEPVGWWHFAHSYVRGHWRKESVTAPSLLTKSCHDIDFLLWMLASPLSSTDEKLHLPARITSTGSLKQFRKTQKPSAAGAATNCLSCPIQETCIFSAPRIYNDRHLAKGLAKWPVDIVNPEIETLLAEKGPEEAKSALLSSLAEDYDVKTTSLPDIEDRPWFGRCVFESDNDVCDDQFVTIEWDDDVEGGQSAKTASFHMIAQTLSQCSRRGRIYGTTGEISYDSSSITVHDFVTSKTETHHPEVPKNSHHGGGDDGLVQQFLLAVRSVMEGTKSVKAAQEEYLGVTLEEVVRSHAVVFAAEEARRERRVVEWGEWSGREMREG